MPKAYEPQNLKLWTMPSSYFGEVWPAYYSAGLGHSHYAHVGQHSGCSMGWYQTTRAATPEEYAGLKRELESAPYGYRFKVYRRIQPWMRERAPRRSETFAR